MDSENSEKSPMQIEQQKRDLYPAMMVVEYNLFVQQNPYLSLSTDIDLFVKNYSWLSSFKSLVETTQSENSENSQKTWNNNMYFVTVNPKPDVSLETLEKKVNSYVKRKIVLSSIYAYEQRGSNINDLGNGIHVHLIVHSDDKDIHPNTRNSFKTLVGDPQRHIDIRRIEDDADLLRRMNYIIGEKKGKTPAIEKDKRLKQKFDIVFRQKYNLNPYYIETKHDQTYFNV